MDLHLPQFSQEIYFAKDTLLQLDSCGVDFGVAGEPVQEMLSSDNLITGLLLLCFVMTLVVYSFFRVYLPEQYRAFSYIPRSAGELPRDSRLEYNLKRLLTFQTCLLFSVGLYFFVKTRITDGFILFSDYYLVAFFLGTLIVYVLLKGMLYTMANVVFFNGKRNRHFIQSLLLVSAAQGVLIFPAVLLYVHFGVSLQIILYYVLFVVVLGKLLAFYKAYVIFFRQKGGFLQIILYFCALEIVPLAILVGTWMVLVDSLKVNY
jgi:hypothetical protein